MAECFSEEKGHYTVNVDTAIVFGNGLYGGGASDRAVVRYEGGRLVLPEVLKTHSSEKHPKTLFTTSGLPTSFSDHYIDRYTLSDQTYIKTLWIELLIESSAQNFQLRTAVCLSIVDMSSREKYTATGTFVSADGTVYAVIYRQDATPGTAARLTIIKKG